MIAELDVRLIQDFIDILILKVLSKNGSATGYSLIRYFHQRYHIRVASGAVYSKLYWLERQGFLEAASDGRRRVYGLTKKGEEYLDTIRTNEQRNHAAFLSIFVV